MTDFVTITLDTQTEVEASINGGSPASLAAEVTLELVIPADVVEVKVWGDIDPTDPANASYAESEGSAIWLSAATSFTVVLHPAAGPKTLHVRVKDDVDNEATDSATITLGEVTTPPQPGVPAPPRSTTPPQRPRPEHVVVESHSNVTAQTSSTVSRTPVEGSVRWVTRSHTGVTRTPPPAIRAYRSTVFMSSTAGVRVGVSRSETWQLGDTETTIFKRGLPDEEALILLDIL